MNLPDIELLETNHSFPGSFPIKVIGTNSEEFIASIVSIFRDELELDSDPEYRLRQTKQGRHTSISFDTEFQSAQQVLAVYARISKADGVVMIL